MKTKTIVIVLILGLGLFAFWGCDDNGTGPDDGNGDDVTELEGTWEGYKIEDGQIEDDKVVRFIISADIIDIYSDGMYSEKCSYNTNNDTSPKQIDLTLIECPYPEDIGLTTLCIYKIEDNVLTICWTESEHDVRPTSFDYSDEYELAVLTKQ